MTVAGRSQSSVLASALALFGAAATMAASFGIARLVSSTDGLGVAGVFFSSTALISIAGTSMAFGTQMGLVYFMPGVIDTDRPNPRGLLRVALGPVLLASVAAGCIVFALSGLLGDIFGGDRSDDMAAVLRLLAPAIPAWSLTNGLLGATRGLGTVTPTVVIQQIGRPLLQIVLLLSVLLSDNLTPLWIAAAWGAPVLLAALAAFVAVAGLGGFAAGDSAPVSSKDYWAFVRPNAVSNSLQIALERGDVLIIAATLGEVAAGIYGGLSRFATAGNFIGYAITQAISPNLRKAINVGDETRAKTLFQRAAAWMILATLPYLLIVGIKTIPMARLLDDKYVADARLLTLLVLGMAVNALAGPVELHLLMRGRSRATLMVTAASLVADVVLIVVLGRWIGLAGAAIAWAISLAGKNLVNSYLSYSWYGVTSLARPAAIAATIATIAIVPVALATPNNFTGLAITLGIGGVITLGLIFTQRDELGLVDLSH